MKKILPLIILWLVLIVSLHAQPKFDSKGTDFWLTFLPNYHNNIDNSDPEKRLGDSLFIFINAENPAGGAIRYTDRFGIDHIQYFAIANPWEMYVFKVSFLDYELWGYNYSGRAWSNYQSDKIAPQSFHITTDRDVTV